LDIDSDRLAVACYYLKSVQIAVFCYNYLSLCCVADGCQRPRTGRVTV